MQKHFVATKKVQFGSENGKPRTIEIGDQIVFDAANDNKLTVYRNENLVFNTTHTPLGVDALVKCKMIEAVEAKAAAPAAGVVNSVPNPPVSVVTNGTIAGAINVTEPELSGPVDPTPTSPDPKSGKGAEVSVNTATGPVDPTPTSLVPPVTKPLAEMSKQEIVDHAKDVHGLDLEKKGASKADLIAKVEEHVAQKASTPVSEPSEEQK